MSSDNDEKKVETNAGAETTGKETPRSTGQRQRAQVQIDDTGILATYANFCRVTGTPEELIIDFGLNPQPIGIPNHPIPVTQRIITNFYTAKRMLHALQMTVQRHEATFGPLEIDVQRRVKPHTPPTP